MLPVLILSVGFSISISDATINELVLAGPQPRVPQNLAPPYINYNMKNNGIPNYPINELVLAGPQPRVPQNLAPPYINYNMKNNGIPNYSVAANPQNAADCPNTAVLLNILNILTNSLPQHDNTVMDLEKFKYVLAAVKNFLETAPLNPENLELRHKFQNLGARYMDKINGPKSSPHAFDNKLRAKISLQYDLPAQRNQNSQELFNNLINFLNTAHTKVLTHCFTTGKCTIDTGNNIHSNYNGIYHFTPIQRNSTPNIQPAYKTLPKEPITTDGLMNFIKIQEGKGEHDIMSILANYRPSGVPNIPATESMNPNGVHSPLIYVNPGNNQATSPNLQFSNIYRPPNMNTVSSQNIFSGLKGLPGDTHENQQYAKLLKKYNEENNVGSNGMETPLQPINGQVVPINTKIPSTDLKEITQINPSINNHQNQLIDVLKQVSNPQQNLLNTNTIKITQTEINKFPNFENPGLTNMYQYLQNLQNIKMQPSIPQNTLSQPVLSHPSMTNYVASDQNQILNQYSPNKPLGVNNQIINQNGLGFNQISPFVTVYDTKYNNGQNVLTDNKQGNNGGQLLDLNHLLSVANLGKLNSIPNKNGIVELTYMVKKPKPVYESQYYVKYRLPYQTFLYNLQNVLVKKPNLRNEAGVLYQELLVGSNVTDTSKDLKGLNYEDILKLTSTNGTLVTAQILENNDTAVDQTLKLVQRLNSKLPVESIIDVNSNVTKNLRLETQKNSVNGSKDYSGLNNLFKNAYPTFFDAQRRGTYPNLNYPYTAIGQYQQRLQYNPYSMYQTRPALGNIGMPLLKYGTFLPNTNILKNPTLYTPNLANIYPQFGR